MDLRLVRGAHFLTPLWALLVGEAIFFKKGYLHAV